MTVTPAEFKAAKPQFASVADATVQSYLDMSALWVSGWPDEWADRATIAVTCHLMTIDGLGADPASEAWASGLGAFESIKSGEVTLSRFKGQAESAGMSTSGWFGQTPCGQQYLAMARVLFGGPRVAMGTVGACVSPYAKDGYRDSWWWP